MVAVPSFLDPLDDDRSAAFVAGAAAKIWPFSHYPTRLNPKPLTSNERDYFTPQTLTDNLDGPASACKAQRTAYLP